ncbi:competence/damage-inducible protein A [Clostridium sp. D2Q-11]|uniref:Putative competence-damage inducible protein n=1 Tax=Anaeromonas frigoriresistens TaxID=2683708 RepID=A0A942V2G4_9FIRM|nr:competence/damage-inducible protein A [Anaeromonas frigoriresistens]MBS4539907.1 competence/damage-inducible protein A [Anaeromonas frigoriresistens]
MNAIVISIGDEILSGDILNTNSQFISKSLKEQNIEVSKIYTIRDNIEDIINSTKESLAHSDIIIVTGGLGPTEDDKTREGVAEALNYNLVLDDSLLKEIKDKFTKNNYIMSDNNIKQAYRIENSIVLKNTKGTAPGMLVNYHNKKIFLLPGPPRELQPMFNKYVLDSLRNKSDQKIFTRTIHTIGIGESHLEEKIKPFFNNNIQIGMYANNGIVDIKVSSKASCLSQAKNNVNAFLNSIDIDKYIWGFDEETLESIVLELLKKNNLTIGFAESLTGGLISSNFTRLSGVSEVFPLSLITYSNASKINLLGVKKETLKEYGAVSKETAIEMAEGLVKKYEVDIALSVTGIAGPTGATKNKPVGLVFIGIANKKISISKKIILNGDRNNIQNRTSLNAFSTLRNFLLKNY